MDQQCSAIVKHWTTSNVACARWAFQVPQGSVETLFSWGGKRLHDFAAKLFRKLYTKFHHNCLSFVRDITRNIVVSFFSWTPCIYPLNIRKAQLLSYLDLRPHCIQWLAHVPGSPFFLCQLPLDRILPTTCSFLVHQTWHHWSRIFRCRISSDPTVICTRRKCAIITCQRRNSNLFSVFWRWLANCHSRQRDHERRN